MIADGVNQGYTEVRVAMTAKRGHRPRQPARPWAKPRSASPRRADDWARELAAAAGMDRNGTAVAVSDDPALKRSSEEFRSAVARARDEAVAFAKGRVAHA